MIVNSPPLCTVWSIKSRCTRILLKLYACVLPSCPQSKLGNSEVDAAEEHWRPMKLHRVAMLQEHALITLSTQVLWVSADPLTQAPCLSKLWLCTDPLNVPVGTAARTLVARFCRLCFSEFVIVCKKFPNILFPSTGK